MSHRTLPLTLLTLLVFLAACNPAYPPAEGVQCRVGDLIDQLMTAAKGKRVVWNNIGGTIANRIDLNNALTGASYRWDELWIHNWAAVTDAQPELLAADGIHLNRDGHAVRAASIADFVRSG